MRQVGRQTSAVRVRVCVYDVGIKHGLWEKLEEGGQHSPKHSFQSNAG